MMMNKKKEIRSKFRESVFKRDGYRCAWCKYKPDEEDVQHELDAHHITDRNKMPNGGYVKENGISLCKEHIGKCHMNAEKFHISNGKEWHDGMHPDDLYKLIGSSYEEAVRKSEKL
jgi:predicted restriction endonuclease